MTGGAASLFHRHRRERGRADDVAGGVDAGRGGLEFVVHLDVAAAGERDAGGIEPEPVDVGDAAERHQHLVGEDAAAVLEFGAHLRDAIPLRGDGVGARDVFAAVAAQLVDVERGELGIEKAQRPLVLVGLRHLAAERGERGGVFAGDDAAAEHQQAARQIGEREDRIAVEHVFVVDGQVRRRARTRARGDDDDAGAHGGLRAVDAAHRELVRSR